MFEILQDPNLLWSILTSNIRILGPWQEAKKHNVEIVGGFWRLTPEGKSGVVVSPSISLYKPNYNDYVVYDEYENILDEDDEGYTRDLALYNRDIVLWKPISYRVRFDKLRIKGYTNTIDEAKILADAELTKFGILLCNQST